MKHYIYPAVSSILLFVLVMLVGGFFGNAAKITAATVGYCAGTYYWLSRPKEYAKVFIGLILAAPPLLLYGPLHVADFNETLLSLPGSIAHIVGILFGFLLRQLNGYARYFASACMVIIAVGAGWGGYNLWSSKVTFGTYSGRVSEPLPNFQLRTERGEVVTPVTLKRKIVVLDFWNTGCGVCYKKFPELEKYHAKYKDNDQVQFYAVNIPLKRDTAGQAAASLKQHGYTFPVLYADKSAVAGAFNVQVYPTVLVMDDKQQIVYRGQLEGAGDLIEELL